VICVDLDHNTIAGGSMLPELPRKECMKLKQALQMYAGVYHPNHPAIGQLMHECV
jgi:hypothetical protein